MKKLFLILFFFICLKSFSQNGYPLRSNIVNDSVLATLGVNFNGGLKGKLINNPYTDTTAANLQNPKAYTGAQIFTTSDQNFWIRFNNGWIKMNGGGGGGTVTGAINGTSLDGSSNVNLGGNPLIQYTNISLSGFPLTINHNGVNNAAQSDSNSIRLTNNTAAATSTDSLTTPSIVFSTNSWKSNGGGSSRNVRFQLDEVGLSNTVFGSALFRLKSSASTNPFAVLYSIDQNGVFQQNLNVQTAIIGPSDQNASSLRFGASALNTINSTSNLAFNNIAIGLSALQNHKRNDQNIAIGIGALVSDTSGADNVSIGYHGMLNNISGTQNTAIGSFSLSGNKIGFNNVAIGYNSMAISDSSFNVAVGYESMFTNTKGYFNTAIGYEALFHNTTGNQNVAIGANALLAATTAIKNIMIGPGAGENITAGGFNVGIGSDVLLHDTLGINNVAVGWLALSNIGSGNSNVGVGFEAGQSLTGGSTNIAIGPNAMFNGSQLVTASNSIAIGSSAFTDASNQMVLGASSITSARIFGPTHNNTPALTVLMIDTTNNNVYHIPASLIVGATPTFEATLNAGSNLASSHSVISTTPQEFAWLGFHDIIQDADSFYLTKQHNGFINDTVHQKVVTINNITGSISMANWANFIPTLQQTLTAGSILTGNNTVANGANTFTIASDAAVNGPSVVISTTSTTVANNYKLFVVDEQGAVGSGITTSALYVNNHKSGTSSVNIGANLLVSNGATNYPLLANGGNSGFGTSTPAKILEVAGTVRLSALGTAVFDTTTYKPLGISSAGDLIPITSWPSTGGGSGIVVGTTTVTSGTSTRILYDNAGVVGEYTLTGSGTVVAMQTSPTFVTQVTDPLLIGSVSANGTLTLEGNNAGAGNTATNANIILKAGDTPTQALDILNNGLVRIGSAPNTTSGYGLVVDQPNDGASNIGIKISANNHTAFLGIGYDKITYAGVLKLEGQGGIMVLGAASATFLNMTSAGLFNVGSSATPTSTLSVDGSVGFHYVAKTANYTATISDYTITGDASGGNFQITLPTAVGITGRIYVIKSISTGTVTVGTTSSQTIDGSTTKILNTQYSGVTVQSNGANWYIIGTF